MSEDQIRRAMERIYEDESVTDELEDDAAELLLTWGEQQITWLASQGLDENTFYEAGHELRRLMKRINRFVGLRADMDDTEQQEAMDEIIVSAQSLGYPVTTELAWDYLQQEIAPVITDSIRAMTALIEQPATATCSPDENTTSDENYSPDEG